MKTVDFSGRNSPLYITLGGGAASRRHVTREDASGSEIERFLGTRLHGFTTIARIDRGHGTIAGSFGSIAVEEGDVVVLPPGIVSYSFAGARRVETVAIASDSGFGGAIRARELPADLFMRSDREVVQALRDAPARVTFRRTDVERSVMEALAVVAADPPSARLPNVAAKLGYTGDGLRALLRRSTGRGFAQWRDALMMVHVRRMLTGDAPVVDIARTFSVDSHYLHRRFARAHGTTPRLWRDAPALPARAAAHEWDALVLSFDRSEGPT